MGIINLDNTIGSDNMKIEKLSENQIRCTLNKSDLISRQLKISELAYGSEKAKELFRDMMQQASYELGFEAEDIPIMIEAIPVSADCIVLIVTKVDDPEELDTRFSKFTPSTTDFDDSDQEISYDDYNSLQMMERGLEHNNLPTAKDELNIISDKPNDRNQDLEETMNLSSDVMNLFSKVKDYLNNSIAQADHISSKEAEKDIKSDEMPSNVHTSSTDRFYQSERNDNPDVTEAATPFVPLKESIKDKKSSAKKTANTIKSQEHEKEETVIRIFSFPSFDYFCQAAKAVCTIYTDHNSLYKDAKHSVYYLTLEKRHAVQSILIKPAISFPNMVRKSI